MGLTDKHLAYGDDIPQTQAEKDYYWALKNLKEKQQVSKKDTDIINNEKYHTCGRCKHDNTPDGKYPCVACIYGTDHRTDLWELKQQGEYEHDHEVVKAYNDGQAYILDKIKAEIEEHAKINQNLNADRANALCWCLDIIDKYREESEE